MEKKNIFSSRMFFIGYMIVIFVIFIIVLWGLSSSRIVYTLSVKGDTYVVVEKGSTYNDLGATLSGSNNKDYSSEIRTENNVDVNNIGIYQVNYYFKDIFVRRIVQVVRSKSDVDQSGDNYVDDGSNNGNSDDVSDTSQTKITLLGKEEVYIAIFGTYKEDGFAALDSKDGNITKNVVVTHNIDNTKPGKYYIKYSVTNSKGEVIERTRTVNVLLVDFLLTPSTNSYTNGTVDININVKDSDMEYLILPDGKTIKDSNYTYRVSDNEEYKFVLYNKYGIVKEKSIKISNINRTNPNVSCSAKFTNGKTVVTIDATDDIGIKSYVVNNNTYNSNVVSINGLVKNNEVIVYDNAGNSSKTTCEVTTSVYIESVKVDGVFVTVNAKSVNGNIKGYYFNYSNNIPSKDSGYVATSNNSIEVVRLAGTTYVWAEDSNGGISEVATAVISNSSIRHSGNILKGTALKDYIKSKGGSLDDFNKLMARSVRAAGLYTKTGAATAGVTLATGLYQKYGVTIPYWRGGKTSSIGAYGSWGIYRNNPTYEGYYYYGMDCDGFVNWTYLNTGIVYNSILANSYYYWDGLPVSKNNGEIGDVMRTNGHVKIIVGKTDSGFIVAEEAGRDNGLIISTHAYTNTGGYIIIKGEELIKRYTHMSSESYPKGF